MGIIAALSENPWTFHYLRKIPEFNYRQTKSRIRQYLDSNLPVLDLGCGTAEFCRCFSPAGYLGVDVSAKYLAYAKRRCPEYAFALGSGAALCLPSQSFPQALINGVIHHLDEGLAVKLLSETHRVLKEDGKLLLIEDIESDASGFMDKLIHALDMGDHIREQGEYKRLVSRLFKIEESHAYYSGRCHYGLWLLRKKKKS